MPLILVVDAEKVTSAKLGILRNAMDFWGEGSASDGSNAYTERIYDQEGNPITYNSLGAIYSKWKALCEAPH